MLREYADYVTQNPRDRAGSFLSFVMNRGYGRAPSGGKSMVGETYRRTLDEIAAEVNQRMAARSGEPSQVTPAA